MANYKTFNGTIITDEMIEEWGKQLDAGIIPGNEGTGAKLMTPDEFADHYYSNSIHVPEKTAKIATEMAKKHGMHVNDYITKLVMADVENAAS